MKADKLKRLAEAVMQKIYFRKERESFLIDIGLWSIHFFYPQFNWNTKQNGVILKTMIAYTYPDRINPWPWPWRHAFVFMILGLGFACSYKHCNNTTFKKIMQNLEWPSE